MFEAQLKSKFERIFGLNKVSFNAPISQPDEAPEQETLFIHIESSVNSFREKKSFAKVIGSAVVFANGEKLPFGYFDKRIKNASYDDTKDLFFHDVDVNSRLIQNVVQRGFSFVYFFNSQYDPDIGTISSIEFTEET